MAQSIQPEMCICRENLEAKVVTLAFTISHIERNAGLPSHGAQGSAFILVPASSGASSFGAMVG
jgi:hypothetical protein